MNIKSIKFLVETPVIEDYIWNKGFTTSTKIGESDISWNALDAEELNELSRLAQVRIKELEEGSQITKRIESTIVNNQSRLEILKEQSEFLQLIISMIGKTAERGEA